MGNSEAINANWSSTARQRFQIGTRSQTCRGKGPERASRRARAREECLSGPTSALRAGRVLTTSEIHCDASGGCAFRPPPRMGKRSQSLGCATPSIPQWTPQASAQIPAGLRAPLEPAHHAARAAPTSCFAESSNKNWRGVPAWCGGPRRRARSPRAHWRQSGSRRARAGVSRQPSGRHRNARTLETTTTMCAPPASKAKGRPESAPCQRR